MKSYRVAAALFALPLCMFAQLNQLPPSMAEDGIPLQSTTTQPQNAVWLSSPLSRYRNSGDTPWTPPAAGTPDAWGTTWGHTLPNLHRLQNDGGTVRLIVMGECGTWLDGAGYTFQYTPQNAGSFRLGGDTLRESQMLFGYFADFRLLAGERPAFDFWLSTQQGVYTLLNPGNSTTAPNVACEMLWTQTPVLVDTFLDAFGRIEPVDTWIVNLAETQRDGTVENYRMAFQFYYRKGSTFPAVPEPSTYGIVATSLCVLAGVLKRRR
jgi:hypothetical protein